MSAKLRRNLALLTIAATSGLILPYAGAEAKRPEEAEAPRPPAAHAPAGRGGGANEAAERAAQGQERKAQQEEARAQQEQFKQQHDAAMKQASQARQQQEQSLREQEQQGRKAQQEAQRAQQEQARQAQQQARQQPHGEPGEGREQPREAAAMIEHGPGGGPGGQAGGQPGGGHSFSFAKDRGGNAVFARAANPPQMNSPRMPLQKAIAMPVLAPNASAADQAHLQEVQANLQQHMYAVAAAYAPSNFHSMPNLARQAYFNNYATMINNQQLIINRQNTYLSALEQSQWPVWYQPQPGWQFCNGFTLGNVINADVNWLRWGWHPYYGPQPDGFVCASNYVPTPWVYLPAYGTWRQPGVNAYAGYGPPFDYTGPISVQVFEPRRVNVDVPFFGAVAQRVINAIYFYNAYYYPQYGRYGYMNRHNNWIWLNTGTQPF